MKKHSKAQTIRRSVALPRRLVEEISILAPADATRNWNRLVVAALEEYAERHRRLKFEAAMAAMAADPAIQQESKKINKAFRKTDRDGLA
jgi:hypothetical protein